MSPRIIIADTGPLSYLTAGGVLRVLHTLFPYRGQVPPSSMAEANRHTDVGRALAKALDDGWLRETEISPPELAHALQLGRAWGLDPGESKALAIAQSRNRVLLCDPATAPD